MIITLIYTLHLRFQILVLVYPCLLHFNIFPNPNAHAHIQLTNKPKLIEPLEFEEEKH